MPLEPKQSKDAAEASEHAASKPKRNGRWKKGESGNPGGRPKECRDLRDFARQFTEEAVMTLVKVMREGNQRAAATAANYLLDRGWGKAPQSMELTGKDGTPLVPVLNVLYTDGRSQSQPAPTAS